MLRDASMGPIFSRFRRPRARHCHLQCFDAQLGPISVLWLVSTLQVLACCLCLVDRALTESGDCSDVWNGVVQQRSLHH